MPAATKERPTDLIGWEDSKEVATNIAELPRKYGLTVKDFGLARTPAMTLADHKAGKEYATKAVANAIRIVINLMRLESGMELTTKPTADWTLDELEGNPQYRSNWGTNARDHVSTARPVRKGGQVGDPAISPNAGWWFRMVEHFSAQVFERLVFSQIETGRNRDEGLKAVGAVMKSE